MPVYERLSMVVSFTLIGLALYFIIDLPTRHFTFEVFGPPVTITASVRLLMATLLGGLAFTGSGAVVRAHSNRRPPYTVPFWVNATLIVILATLTLARLGSPLAWAIGLLVTGILLWFTILAEYYVLEGEEKTLGLARLWSQWVSYALMLAHTILIYEAQMAPVFNVASMFLLAGLLGVSIFKLYAPAGNRIGLFGFLMALGMGEIAWAFNYWRLNATGLGLLTLLIFYLLSGIVISYLQNKLSRRVLAEYAAVMLVGLWIITQFLG